MQFRILSRSVAPRFSKTPKKIREVHQLYDGFITMLPAKQVGELELLEGEEVRSVKVNLRRASTRLGRKIDIWDAGSRSVFFTVLK